MTPWFRGLPASGAQRVSGGVRHLWKGTRILAAAVGRRGCKCAGLSPGDLPDGNQGPRLGNSLLTRPEPRRSTAGLTVCSDVPVLQPTRFSAVCDGPSLRRRWCIVGGLTASLFPTSPINATPANLVRPRPSQGYPKGCCLSGFLELWATGNILMCALHATPCH